MTVAELIQLLQPHPQDMRVVVDGYEDGFDDLTPQQLTIVTIAPNAGSHWWEGQHGDATGPNNAELVKALALRRVSTSITPA